MPNYTTLTGFEAADHSDRQHLLAAAVMAASGHASAEFDALAGEHKVRILRQAQAALRFLEADLVDEPDRVAARHKALGELAGGMPHYGWPAELATEEALPSYRRYWEAVVAVLSLLSLVDVTWDEDGDNDPDFEEELGQLNEVLKHLLRFARDEAALVGVDLDDLMRGWFAGTHAPLGSPTAGLART
jgi:hypothetical protein